jgi:hypothetical protein
VKFLTGLTSFVALIGIDRFLNVETCEFLEANYCRTDLIGLTLETVFRDYCNVCILNFYRKPLQIGSS